MARPARARLTAADRRRRGLVALSGGLSIVLCWSGLGGPVPWRSGPGAGGPPTPDAAVTPIWSARRAPTVVGDALGAQVLADRLGALAAGGSHCHLVVDGGGVVSAAAPDDPLVPASTLKLVTGAAALLTLGADARLETRVVAEGPVGRDGRVERLWLVGGGDPLLVTPEGEAVRERDPRTRGLARSRLAELAEAVVRAGVRAVPGGIFGDGSRYPDEAWPPAWPDRHRRSAVSGPVVALAVDDGLSGPGGTGAPVTDPAREAAAALARLLAARGVRVGGAGSGPAPAGAVTVAALASPPVRDLVGETLAASDNRTAEVLLREVALAAGRPAVTAAGVAAVGVALRRVRLGMAARTMVDGSGLAPGNRLRCRTLVALLRAAARRPELAALREGLAVAGERGTLATQFVGTALVGRLRAKTGTLDGVAGLAGFVDGDRPLVFALLVNGSFGESAGIARRERMATAIAAFPDVGDPAEWVPGPRAPAPGA